MGKGGGALSAWLKEFTALVFTQTIQAFIYAIIISIILFSMDKHVGVSANDNNSALGLMSVFALLSVFKVEDMAKKIFGVGDTKAGHKGAMQSLAKTAIAANLGKRVLNNGAKILGGTRAVVQSGFDKGKLKRSIKQETEKASAGGSASAGGATAGASSSGNMSDAQKKYYDKAKQAKANGDMNGYKKYMEKASFARTIENSVGSSGGGAGNGGSDAEVKQKLQAAEKEFKNKLEEINKARNEGWKSIASGLTETAGAVLGGTTAGLFSAADGNFDNIVKDIVSGMGAGDAIGKSTIDGLETSLKFATRNVNRLKNREWVATTKGVKKALEKYEAAYENYIKDVGDIET